MTTPPDSSRLVDRPGLGAWLWRRPRRWYLLGVPLGGLIAFLVGIAATGGFLGGIKHAETMAFCSTSCHEMSYAHSELAQNGTHGTNAVGVTATCADCHVPPGFIPGLVRHMKAVNEVWGHFRGTLDSPARYEVNRARMADSVWQELKANDSAECRHCHDPARMDYAKQPSMAASAHKSLASGSANGITCIDCHRGVAHTLPAS